MTMNFGCVCGLLRYPDALELLPEKGQLDAVLPASASKLALELLREKFSLGAVDAFRAWCKAHGVEHKFKIWP